jgi:tyrosinase
MRNPSRRSLLVGTASAAIAGAIAAHWPTQGQTIYVRQSIAEFSKDAAKVDAYRAGVRRMKSRPVGDPTSWAYQANIHGVVSGTTLKPAWRTCDHGTWYFLPWHRMYIYWFERILRRASGDPTFALPYWDYSDPDQRLLPRIFREPANTSNSLYEPNRRSSFNAGTAGLDSEDVDHSAAFRQTVFASTSFPYGFGGYRRGHSHTADTFGEIESSPHNLVHGAIGGLMGDVPMAARDPIFWVHHANIDRLWNSWLALAGGRANPTNASWRNRSFTFFNQRGVAVTETVQQFLSRHTDEYRYDTEPAPAAFAVAGRSEATEPSAMTAATTLARRDRPVELGARPVSVQLAPTPSFGGPPTSPRRLFVGLSKLRSKTPPGSNFDVYLNLPGGTAPPNNSLYFVGRLSFFGRSEQEHGRGHHDDEGLSVRAFDVTELARRQARARVWRSPPVVTIAPVYPEDVNGTAMPTIGMIELVLR